MKANHIPVAERLQNRINKLEFRLEEGITRNRKRFYAYCKYCDRDIISIHMDGHHTFCRLRGIDKQIAYFQKLLIQALTAARG